MLMPEMMYIIILIIMGVVLFAVVLFGWLFYLVPLKRTPAGDIVRAWRKKKTLVFLDEEGRFTPYIIDKEIDGGGKAETGDIIRILPAAIKNCKELRMGVGDGQQGVAINAGVMRVIDRCVDLGINQDDLNKVMFLVEQGYTPDDIRNMSDAKIEDGTNE